MLGLAATSECIINGQVRPPAECEQLFRTVSGTILAFIVPLVIIGILLFIPWLIMIIHAAQNEVPDKTLWLVLMIIVPIACIPYYFAIKRPFDKAREQAEQKT